MTKGGPGKMLSLNGLPKKHNKTNETYKCIIFAHGLGANVDLAEHGWHGREVGGWRRSEQRRWWLAEEESVKSQVVRRVRRCNSRFSTTQEPIRVFVDRPCLGKVEVVESCGDDSSRPIQSCWYEPAYSAGSPTWHQGHALSRPVWPLRHRHGYSSQVPGVSRASSACRTKSILSYQNSVEVGGLSTIRELIRHSSRSWGDRHPSPGGLSCREAGCRLHIDGIWSRRTSLLPVGPPCNRRKFEVQQPILEEIQTSVYVDQNPRCQLETFVSVPRNMTSFISGRHGSFRIFSRGCRIECRGQLYQKLHLSRARTSLYWWDQLQGMPRYSCGSPLTEIHCTQFFIEIIIKRRYG